MVLFKFHFITCNLINLRSNRVCSNGNVHTFTHVFDYRSTVVESKRVVCESVENQTNIDGLFART